MSKKTLFALWGGLFILCAGLGFIPGFSRNVSAGAQAVLTVLSAMGTVTMGNALFGVLIVVSSPMVCSGYWALSLFLWACLLMVSHSLVKKVLC